MLTSESNFCLISLDTKNNIKNSNNKVKNLKIYSKFI